MPLLYLNVLLPTNRNISGWLRIEKDGSPIAEFEVLGRGSRGPGNTVLLERGNTPTGTFRGTTEDTTGRDQNAYGPFGAVRLKATDGDAVIAEQIFGRSGLLIHGGSLAEQGPWKGGLKPTWGCLRLHNTDMKRLMDLISEFRHEDGVCRDVDIQVGVTEM